MARVLYIEDDPGSAERVESLLRAAGHDVATVHSGLEGIQFAHATRPDLILVDITLPDLNGYEVTLRLRGIRELAQTPIVAVSSDGDPQTSLAVGADGFIDKPVDARRFVKLVHRFLGGHRVRADESGEIRLRQQSQRISEHLEQKVRELSAANERLEEMARLRREFLQNVTHELATPMTPVVGYLRLLLDEELGPLTPLQRKCLLAIERSNKRLRQVMDTLLDVSSLETGRMHYYRLAYDFQQIASQAIQEVQPRLLEQGVLLRDELQAIPMPAFGDAEKLRRAMVHVLDNALKSTPSGSQIAVAVRAIGEPGQKRTYEMLVADSGPGIPVTEIERILEPFYQVDGSMTRKFGGVGLGLAFARRVTEAMSGHLSITSPPDENVAGVRLSGTLVRLRVSSQPVLATPAGSLTRPEIP